MQVFNFEEKFKSIQEYWSPHIVAELNGQYLKIAKVKGEFIWHKHDNEDELFYVVKGSLDIHFKDDTKRLEKGDLLCIPRGVEHKPQAEEECWIALFEPKETLNTGDKLDELTKTELKKL